MSSHRNNIPMYSSLANLLSDSQQTNAPIWSADETILLEQQLSKIDPIDDDLKTVLMIAPWFPHKSIQQISLRMRWIRLHTTQSWDDFCKANDNRQQKMVVNNMSENSPIESSSGPSSYQSSSQSSPKPPQESPFRVSFRTSKSEDFVRQHRQRRPSQPQSTFLAKSNCSTNPIKNEPQKQQQMYDITTLIKENEEILRRIETNIKYTDDFVALSKSDMVQFGVNLRLLLGMTDSTAKPKELPFMPMILNISSDMATIPQEIQTQIQQRDLSTIM